MTLRSHLVDVLISILAIIAGLLLAIIVTITVGPTIWLVETFRFWKSCHRFPYRHEWFDSERQRWVDAGYGSVTLADALPVGLKNSKATVDVDWRIRNRYENSVILCCTL